MAVRRAEKKAKVELLEQNLDVKVRTETATAFGDIEQENTQDAVTNLQERLVGVDFTTAILILSSAYPQKFPFPSEELCRWANVDNFSAAEDPMPGYMELKRVVDSLVQRMEENQLPATAGQVEKVAYVLDRWKNLKSRHIPREN